MALLKGKFGLTPAESRLVLRMGVLSSSRSHFSRRRREQSPEEIA